MSIRLSWFYNLLLTIVTLHFTLYTMIKSFADRTQKSFTTPENLNDFRLIYGKEPCEDSNILILATSLNDLRVPPTTGFMNWEEID